MRSSHLSILRTEISVFFLSVSTFLLASVLVSIPLSAHAEKSLGLDAFIQEVLAHNPGVQRILAQEAIAKAKLESNMGVDDYQLTSSANVGRTEFDQIIGFEPNTSFETGLALNLDRTFSRTGTSANVGYGFRYVDRSSLPLTNGLGSTYYQPSFTVRLTQPLLKNLGGVQDRLGIDLGRLNVELARLNSHEQLESYITRLAALYLAWYQGFRESDILHEAYQRVMEQEKLVKLKVQRQVADPHELLRVQETREDYFSRWKEAEGSFYGRTPQIKKQMRSSSVGSAMGGVKEPVDPRDSALLKTFANGEGNYLSTGSRLKKILDNLLAQQDELLAARDDAKKADLDLSFTYNRHGADPSFGEAHSGSLDKNDYSLLLDFRFPLQNRRARGEYLLQMATKRQVKSDTEQQMIDAESALADLQVQEGKLKEALNAVDRKISLSKKKLEKERRLYRIGRLDLFELLQDSTAHMESQLNRTQLYVRLQQIRLSVGELLDRNLQPYLKEFQARKRKS